MSGTRDQIEEYILDLHSRGDHEPFSEIADQFGVSGRWVRIIRDDLYKSGQIDVTSDFAPQSAKWEAGREFIKENPEASTEKVASAVDVSLPTARKIRSDWEARKEVVWQEWMEGDTLYPYIGSKEKITGWILWKIPEFDRFKKPKRYSRLPDHRTFVEVFGGSATLLYNKPPSQVEVYNDLNEDYSQFIKTLRDHGEEIKHFLEGVKYSREQYEDWENRWYRDEEGWYTDDNRPVDDVKRAAVFFFLRFGQFMGKDEAAGYRRPSKNRPQSKEYYRKRDRLPEFQKRFSRDDPGYFQDRFDLSIPPILDRPVEVQNLHYGEVLDKYDDGGALHYLDPPYVDKEAYYPVNSNFDHDALVKQLTDLEGEFILSYGEALPDGLHDYRKEILEHPTGDRIEHLIFSYPEEDEGDFEPPGHGDTLASDW